MSLLNFTDFNKYINTQYNNVFPVRGDYGGKVNIFEGDSMGHGEKK